MGDITAAFAKRIEHKGPFAIGQQTVETLDAQFEWLLVAFGGVKKLFCGVLGDNVILLKNFKTVF